MQWRQGFGVALVTIDMFIRAASCGKHVSSQVPLPASLDWI
ncbi:uncharacterized protein METZ01_LOCUS52982 [marine metagenome]|uniref:Uncharacterized protein n=1 Tax=marine metagenome TaxID=408172 RepID=A0A381S9Z4_9ZZZZ